MVTSDHRGPAQLSVTVIPSACDGYQIKELTSSAGVGTVCVAVVSKSLEQVSREIWRAAWGDLAAQNEDDNRSGGYAGLSSLSAGFGAMRLRLRRYVQAYATRGSDVARGCAEACLVLYCKLAGGTLMASPLDGPVFQLREESPIVEDEEATTRETRDGTRQV